MADNLIVLSRQLSSYLQVAQSLSDNLESPSRIVTLNEFEAQSFDSKGYRNIIAVGSKAGDSLFHKTPNDQKLYISFLPRQTYKKILQKYADHPRTKKRNVTAVYLDQPYQRQLALARLLAPKAKTIATALGPNSQNDLGILKEAARQQGLTLKYETLQESDNPIHKLQPLIRGTDLFLSLPDKSVFNRTTAKWVLYISFRQRIPLIGFSKKYVEAGALAAVHSTPAQIGRHTAELVEQYSHSPTLPAAQYPKYFSVSTNETAARSLRLNIPSASKLNKMLRGQEK